MILLAACGSLFLMYVRADTGLTGAVRAEAPCLFAMWHNRTDYLQVLTLFDVFVRRLCTLTEFVQAGLPVKVALRQHAVPMATCLGR